MSSNTPTARLARTLMLDTESPLHDLEAIIRSRTPLIAVESNEEPQIVTLVRQIAARMELAAFRWTVTEGLQAFDPNEQPAQSVLKSNEVLSYIKNSSKNSMFVLLDFHPYLQDAVHVRHLKDIALSYAKHFSTVVIVGYAVQMPEELKPFTAPFRLPLPTMDELRRIVFDAAAEWGGEHGQREVETTNKAMDLLVRNLVGLTATDARRLATKAINDDGVIAESEMPGVMRAKYELLGRDSPLSFEYETAKFSDIGGMARLRQWLEVRKSFFTDGSQPNLDPPRGMLLLGVQGCGKSLAAKAAAGIFGVPLLRLDFGVLYNKYYGETERNLRKALETAEVMSPCVLWMDEIERASPWATTMMGFRAVCLARCLLGCLNDARPCLSSQRQMTSRGCRRKWFAKVVSTKSFLWTCRRRRIVRTFLKSTCASATSYRRSLICLSSRRRRMDSQDPRSSRPSCRRCTRRTRRAASCRNPI